MKTLSLLKISMIACALMGVYAFADDSSTDDSSIKNSNVDNSCNYSDNSCSTEKSCSTTSSCFKIENRLTPCWYQKADADTTWWKSTDAQDADAFTHRMMSH
jgi:hypothetical protein